VDDLSQFFAQILVKGIDETHEDRYFSLALSGGSTPRSIFQYLAVNFRETITWKRVLVFWSDERCVPPDSPESNFRMTRENLLDHIPIPSDNIIRIKGEADPMDEALHYTETVRQFLPSFNGIPRFDLMMLGVGIDGHTASIFPDNLSLFKSEKLFEVVEHPQTRQQRITATGNLINNSSRIVFLATGDTKSKIVKMILEHKSGSEKFPASLVYPVKGELLWLLDDKAARSIIKNP